MEAKIGKWVDGKDLYRLTLYGTIARWVPEGTIGTIPVPCSNVVFFEHSERIVAPEYAVDAGGTMFLTDNFDPSTTFNPDILITHIYIENSVIKFYKKQILPAMEYLVICHYTK